MYKVIYALGVCIAVLGIASLLAGLGPHNKDLVYSTGSSLFSLGALTIAAGFYLHSRKIRSEFEPKEKKTDKKSERLCSVCNREVAQVFCRVHVLRLCPACLDNHDDGKNCLYVPARRAAAAYK